MCSRYSITIEKHGSKNVKKTGSVPLAFEKLRKKIIIASMADIKIDPELKKLLQLRKALVALKGPMGNMPDFRKAVLEAIKDEDSRKQLLLELKDEKDKE